MRISNDIGDQKDISDNLKSFWLKILFIKYAQILNEREKKTSNVKRNPLTHKIFNDENEKYTF